MPSQNLYINDSLVDILIECRVFQFLPKFMQILYALDISVFPSQNCSRLSIFPLLHIYYKCNICYEHFCLVNMLKLRDFSFLFLFFCVKLIGELIRVTYLKFVMHVRMLYLVSSSSSKLNIFLSDVRVSIKLCSLSIGAVTL